MRAAIFNPYLDTLGGGERYTMGVSQVLDKAGYRVSIQWENKSIKKKLEERFGIELDKIDFVKSIGRGDGYDVCFWVSDGSIPLLRARKNLLHFQVPFTDVNGKTLLNKMKLFRIGKVICNSYFTKRFIDKEFGVESAVIYPPVDVEKIKPGKKENLIIFVGRFSQLKQAKNQAILIRAFKKFFDSGFKDWSMVLAGGVEVGVGKYVEKLKREGKNYPIKIVESPSFTQVRKLYAKAKIFWSAAGYGVREQNKPQKVEHFGISVVEAMAAGVVPVIFEAGGYKEIIADGENGIFWKSTASLINKTKKLVKERGLMSRISAKARKDSKIYEYSRFEAEFLKLL